MARTTTTKPAAPVATKPAAPVATKPAAPVATKPAAPVATKPNSKAAIKAARVVLAPLPASTAWVLLHNGACPVRGSRAARWPLFTKGGTIASLAAALKAGGHPQTAKGTLAWLVAGGYAKVQPAK